MAPWTFVSRLTLIVINTVCVIFACLIIYYGSVGLLHEGNTSANVKMCYNASDPTSCQDMPILEHPFAGLVALGTFILIFSICGIVGACCAVRFKEEATSTSYRRMSSRALMVYYTGVMLTNAGLFYVAMLCFLFAEKASDYINAYWVAIEPQLCGSPPYQGCTPDTLFSSFRRNTNAGGIIALLTIAVNYLCAHCSAILMGYQYTMRKAMLMSNFCGFVIGLITVVIAFLPSTQAVGARGAWLPAAVGVLGLAVLFLSLLGFFAAFRLQTAMLMAHAILMSLVVIFLFSFGVYCLADANGASAMVEDSLPALSQYVNVCPQCPALNATSTAPPSPTDPAVVAFKKCCYRGVGLVVWNNLTVLGVSAIVTVLSMIVNIGGSLYLRRRVLAKGKEATEAGEIDPVSGQELGRTGAPAPPGGGMGGPADFSSGQTSRQAARAKAYHAGEDPADDL